jgi:hypothetical protein
MKEAVMVVTCSMHGRHGKCSDILTGKEEAVRETEHKWEDNIRMALKQRGCENVGWNQLAKAVAALLNTVG